MACESCQRYQQRQQETLRLNDQQKRQCLAEACDPGDQRSWLILEQITAFETYRQENCDRAEHLQ